MVTLRGSGPAPAGYIRCMNGTCPARRDPFTGRYTARGKHYHPVPNTYEAASQD